MSNVLQHRFVSPKLDGSDATQVQPSAWNDGHRFSGGAHGAYLTRDTADATFGASWTTPAPPVGWVAYTPIWYIAGVAQPTVTHTVLAHYHRVGDAVWFRVVILIGSAAIAAGGWEIGLPFPCGFTVSPGTGQIYASTGAIYPLFQTAAGLSDRVGVLYLPPAGGALGGMTATVPVAITAGAAVEIRGNYQA